MDYEKAYKDAVSKIKSIIADKKKQGLTNCLFEGDLNEIFPEFAESEDEKIRKWCISHFRECINVIKDNDEYKEYLSNKVLTWLEKQDPKKFEEELEKAYKFADEVQYRKGYEDAKREIEKQCEKQKTRFDLIMWKPVSEYTGGRVLTTNGVDILVGYINSDGDCESEDCEGTLLCGVTGFVKIEDVLPPKQDEQNSADSYCKDNCKGYQKTGKCFAYGECKAKRDAENKPTQEIESFEAEHGKYYYCIKDYFCGGRKQAFKGDVVQALRGLPIMSLKDASEYFLPVNNIQKPAWSDEDEKMMQLIHKYVKPSASNFDYQNIQIWFKSLKDRLQPHWKPTDEQMEALDEVCNGYYVVDILGNDVLEKIISLYNNLKNFEI